jgi:hypothetical protein
LIGIDVCAASHWQNSSDTFISSNNSRHCGGKLRVIACTRHGFTRALLGLRPNRTLVLACTRHGFTRALLGLRPNRTLVLACTEDSSLIAKILGHVHSREAGEAAEARALPADSQQVPKRL